MINENLEKSDIELVDLSLANPDNYVFIIEKYNQKLEKYIKRLGNIDKESVDDLLQDVFLKVYKNLNGFDKKLKFSSWIYRIAHNETINFFKKNNRNVNLDFDDIDYFINKISDCIDCKKDDIENKIDNKILKENIDYVFSKMDQKYRDVLILKFIEDKDYNEISDIIKKPLGTVATLINRAKKQFKEIYEHK